MITITNIVSFILRHRGNSNAFKGATAEELYDAIQIAMDDECVVVDSNSFGDIYGVVMAEFHPEYHRLHIVGLLAISPITTAKFAKWLLERKNRDGWEITALRRGRYVAYDTQRLLNKLITRYGKSIR